MALRLLRLPRSFKRVRHRGEILFERELKTANERNLQSTIQRQFFAIEQGIESPVERGVEIFVERGIKPRIQLLIQRGFAGEIYLRFQKFAHFR